MISNRLSPEPLMLGCMVALCAGAAEPGAHKLVIKNGSEIRRRRRREIEDRGLDENAGQREGAGRGAGVCGGALQPVIMEMLGK